jgi:SpoVK/Ycf46/Vps4 family AAA+-type ATPase
MMSDINSVTELAVFQERVCKHSGYVDALVSIERLQVYKGRKPKALMLVGDSGTGKTFLGEQLAKNYSERYKSNIATLYVDATEHTNSELSVALELLDQLGAPKPMPSRLIDARRELKSLLKNTNTKLIIFDEVQDWLPKTDIQPDSKMYKFFKSFLNKNKLPCLLLGVNDAIRLFSNDRQLRDRFLPTKHIKSFNCTSKDKQIEFALTLEGLFSVMPRDCSGLSLTQKKIIKQNDGKEVDTYFLKKGVLTLLLRFCLATKGIMRRISDLLGECILLTKPNEKITLVILVTAYSNVINEDKYNNPFAESTKRAYLKNTLKNEGLA